MESRIRQRVGEALVLLALGLGAYGLHTAERGTRGRQALKRALLEVLETSDRQEARIAELEDRLSRQRAVRSASVAAAPQKPVVVRETRTLSDGGVPVLAPREVARSVPSARAEGERARFEQAAAGRTEDTVEGRIERLARRQEARNAQGEWEAPVGELSAELKLTPEQEEFSEGVFNQAHEDLLELLRVPREDGGSIADDFAADLQSGMTSKEATEVLVGRLLTEQVPSSGHLYLQELITMRIGVLDQLEEQYTEEQVRRLEQLRIDPLNVKTGADPFREYIESKLAE